MRLAFLLLLLLVVPSIGVAQPTQLVGPQGSDGQAMPLGPEPTAATTNEPEDGHTQEVWIWSPRTATAHAHAPTLLTEAIQILGDLDPKAPTHRYEHLNMLAFVAPTSTALQLAKETTPWGRVTANERMELNLDQSVPYIEADRVRRVVGEARSGPAVLVVDTGVDGTHPDFSDENLVANVGAKRAGGLVVGTLEQVPVIDAAGHGTHVAGIVAGSGSAGPYEGLYSNGRVASYQASTPIDEAGQEPAVDTVAALEAFDWALEHRHTYDLRVVTNSWGLSGEFEPDHPVNEATLRLYLAGMVVVFSGGNLGEAGTLNRHCLPPWVLCVAAGDLQRSRAPFSSYGKAADPSRPWDHPDLTAPGHFIRAPRPMVDMAGGTTTAFDRLMGTSRGDFYVDRSGTSMAAPHVAGAAGLLLAGKPRLSPDEVMDALVGSTLPMADDVQRVGTGYLNVRAAFNAAQTMPGSLDAFLAGRQVKYGGATTGDPDYARDPVTAGLDPDFAGAVLLPPAQAETWISTPPAWIILGLAAIVAATGVRFGRKRRQGSGGPAGTATDEA